MANSDVKVKEIKLLEAYSNTYTKFMDETIHMSFRFRTLFNRKGDQARDLKHKIDNHLNIAQQKLAHAKTAYEASLRRGGGAYGNELRQREQALEKYKALYQKAKNYAESAKKLYQKIHGEVERVDYMSARQRHKLERSREEGKNFLDKAITALNEYSQ